MFAFTSGTTAFVSYKTSETKLCKHYVCNVVLPSSSQELLILIETEKLMGSRKVFKESFTYYLKFPLRKTFCKLNFTRKTSETFNFPFIMSLRHNEHEHCTTIALIRNKTKFNAKGLILIMKTITRTSFLPEKSNLFVRPLSLFNVYSS